MRPYDRNLSQFDFFEQIMVVSRCGISKSHNHITYQGSKPLSGFLISTDRVSCETSLDLYFYCFCKRSEFSVFLFVPAKHHFKACENSLRVSTPQGHFYEIFQYFERKKFRRKIAIPSSYTKS